MENKLMTTIQEMSTTDLIDELSNRFEIFVLLGKKVEDGNEANSFYHYTGSIHCSRGLVKELDSILEKEMIKNIIEENKDE